MELINNRSGFKKKLISKTKQKIVFKYKLKKNWSKVLLFVRSLQDFSPLARLEDSNQNRLLPCWMLTGGSDGA